MKVYTSIYLLLGIVFLLSSVSAADFTPQGNINLRDIYAVHNATYVTSALYCNADNSTCYPLSSLAASALGSNFWGDGGDFLYPNSTFGDNLVVYGYLNATDWSNVSITASQVSGLASTSVYSITSANSYVNLNSSTGVILLTFNESVLNNTIALLIPTSLSEFTDDLGDRGYTDLINFTNSQNLLNFTDLNSSEFEEQGDGKVGIIDSFIQAITNSRITAVVTQAFVKALGFGTYDEINTTIDQKIETDNSSQQDHITSGLAAQDECSEITGCVENAITDGNTNWDNTYGFFDDLNNFTGTLTDTKYCTYDQTSDLINCTSEGGSGSTYYNGTGLGLNGTGFFSILLGYRLPQGCNDGEISEYNTTSGGWDCAINNPAASGMSNWVLAASDTGGSESITDGETVTISDDAKYINVTRSTNTITIAVFETKLNTTIQEIIDSQNFVNFSGDFGDLTNIPSGLEDGDNDTQLSGAQVAAYVDNASIIRTDSNAKLGDVELTGHLNLSTNDEVIFLYSNKSLLGGTPSSGGINIVQTIPEAKGGIYWDAYDDNTGEIETVGWIVCHYNSTSNPDAHSHCAFETLDNSTGTPSINTHFYVTYGNEIDRAVVGVSTADFVINNLAEFNTSDNTVFTPYTTLDIYPNSQSAYALRVTNDSNAIQLQGLGVAWFEFLDSINSTGEICDGSGNCLSDPGQDLSPYYFSQDNETDPKAYNGTLVTIGTLNNGSYFDTDTQLSQEQVEDYVGGMVDGNFTYIDASGVLTVTTNVLATTLRTVLDPVYRLAGTLIGNTDIAEDSINTTQIIDGTIKDTDLDLTNITVGDFTNDAGYVTTDTNTFNTTEEMQDAVGAALDGNFTYDDAGNAIHPTISGFLAWLQDHFYTETEANAMNTSVTNHANALDSNNLETTTSFSGEVSGNYNSLVVSDTALDDRYFYTEGNLTGLLNDNYEPISAHFDASTTTNITCFNSACSWYMNATDSCEYLSNGGKRCAL